MRVKNQHLEEEEKQDELREEIRGNELLDLGMWMIDQLMDVVGNLEGNIPPFDPLFGPLFYRFLMLRQLELC